MTKEELKDILIEQSSELTEDDYLDIAKASRRSIWTVRRYFLEGAIGNVTDAEFFRKEAQEIIATKNTPA